MFPLRDDNTRLLTPYVTLGLIALTILSWLIIQGAGTEPQLSISVCTLGVMAGELLQQLPAAHFGPVLLGRHDGSSVDKMPQCFQ